MGPTRFPYGQALGFSNNFFSNKLLGPGVLGTGTAGDISGTATPNVTIGGLFYANNTAALTITGFTLDQSGSRSADYEGKVINLIFLDTATNIANAGTLFLQGTDNLAGANHGLELIFSRGNWYEISRWKDNQNGGVSNFTGAGTVAFNANDINMFVFTGTAATTLRSISGGQVAQNVAIFQNTGGVTLTIDTSGNILVAGTNAVVVRAGDTYELYKVNATQWSLVRSAP